MSIIDSPSKKLKGLFTYQAAVNNAWFYKKIEKVPLLQVRRQEFVSLRKVFANYYTYS